MPPDRREFRDKKSPLSVDASPIQDSSAAELMQFQKPSDIRIPLGLATMAARSAVQWAGLSYIPPGLCRVDRYIVAEPFRPRLMPLNCIFHGGSGKSCFLPEPQFTQ